MPGGRASSAIGASKHGKRIAVERSSGDYAAASDSASVKRPRALYMRVIASPRQRVTGNWSVTCVRGGGSGSRSGKLSGVSPEVRRMRLPMRRPDYCGIGVLGQLKDSGRIRVEVYRR